MATIKGLGYNATNVRNQTAASGDTIEVDGSITSAEGVTVTTGGLTVSAGGASITGNSSISGNLAVSGTLISQDELQVLVKDNFLDLNFGYIGTSYEQTGLTFNYQATSSGVGVDASTNNINFTAGTTTDRAKVVVDTASGIPSATFAAGDIIQISNTPNGDNDGIYVVHDNTTAGTIEFKSDTLTSPDSVNAKFALLDVTTEEITANTVAFRKVNLMALRSSNTGVLQSATGATDSDFATYTNIGAGSVTLQNAYDNGQTITVDANNLAIDDTSAGANDFTIGSTNRFANFSADATSVAFTAESTSGGMTLISEGTAGGDMAFLIANNASASMAFGYDPSSPVTQLAITTTAVEISDDLSMNQASGEQLISRAATGAAQDLKVAVTGNFDSSLILQGQGSGSDALKIFTSDNGGSIDIDSAAAITVDATTGLSLDAGAASNLTTSAGALTLDGAGGVNIAGNSSEIDITTTGALDLNSGGFTLDASTLSIDSTDTSNITMTANDGGPKVFTIAGLNSGAGDGSLVLNGKTDIALQNGGTSVAKILSGGLAMESGYGLVADTSGGFQLGLGATVVIQDILDEDDMSSDSDSALATQQSIKAYVDSVAGASTIQLEAAVNISARDVVAIALTGGDAGKAIKADADSADTCQVIGFAEAAATATNTVTIRTSGNLTGFSGLTAGNKLYADTATAGGVTATAPSGSGDVIFQVGYARSATEVIIVPRYIMELG